MNQRRILIILLLISVSIVSVFVNRHSDPEEHFDRIYELKDKDTGRIQDSIIQYLRTKKLIAIGESSHGTKEFYDLRNTIIESYLKKDNVSINILIEITIPEGLALHNFITNDSIDFEILHKIHYPLLKNSSFKSLLEICRQANHEQAIKDNVRIFGIEPSYDKSLIDHLNGILVNSEIDTQIPNDHRNYFRDLKFKNLIDLSSIQRDSIKHKLLDLRKSISVSSNIKYSLAIEQFLQALIRLEVPINSLRSLNIRDSCMAKNIELITSSDSSRNNIIFAHNEHISINTSSYGIKPMGSFLNSTFKEGYYPIAVDFIEGTYRVNKNSNATTILHSENKDTWLKQILLNKVSDVYYMKTDTKDFDRKINLHAIGGRSHSTAFQSHNLMNDYKAFILFKLGTPTDPIDID